MKELGKKISVPTLVGSFSSDGGIAGKSVPFTIRDERARGGLIEIDLGYLDPGIKEKLFALPWETDDYLDFNGGPQIRSSRRGEFQTTAAQLLALIAPCWGMTIENMSINDPRPEQFFEEGKTRFPYAISVTQKMREVVIESQLRPLLMALCQATQLLHYCDSIQDPATPPQKHDFVVEIMRDITRDRHLIPSNDRETFNEHFFLCGEKVKVENDLHHDLACCVADWDSNPFPDDKSNRTVGHFLRTVIEWLCQRHHLDFSLYQAAIINYADLLEALKTD
ncbi:MAG: hypothetical protein Q7S37_04975 [bacterium]|nr:hypothetical protein [bacterium]